MKVKNETHWQTRDLKHIFCEVLHRSDKVEGRLPLRQRDFLEVEVVHTRHPSRYSGQAHYGGAWMLLRIPKNELDGAWLACLFEHELEHIRGYHHRSMSRAWALKRFAWATNAEKFPFRKKEVRPKPKVDLQLKRYANVLRKMAEKERALKRLQKLLKKWRQKQRYYEKVLVAAGKLPERRRK